MQPPHPITTGQALFGRAGVLREWDLDGQNQGNCSCRGPGKTSKTSRVPDLQCVRYPFSHIEIRNRYGEENRDIGSGLYNCMALFACTMQPEILLAMGRGKIQRNSATRKLTHLLLPFQKTDLRCEPLRGLYHGDATHASPFSCLIKRSGFGTISRG